MTGLGKWRAGGCHCGAVRFEVQAPDEVDVSVCNCSMCRKTGFVHLIVSEDRFRLLQGDDAMTIYRFNTKTALHLFCATCGIKAFYRPRSRPDGWSVNLNALDDPGALEIKNISQFDGQNWETYFAGLSDAERAHV